MTIPFKCSGCGAASRYGVKPCDCPTEIGFCYTPEGKAEVVWFTTPLGVVKRAILSLLGVKA